MCVRVRVCACVCLYVRVCVVWGKQVTSLGLLFRGMSVRESRNSVGGKEGQAENQIVKETDKLQG